jgi:energy-coupling factor transport system permease protein
MSSLDPKPSRKSPRQRRPVVLLRPLPGRTPVHELWAGTKLLVVAGVGVLLALYPGWAPIALVSVLVLLTARLARVPWGALPSAPRWLWIVLVIGAVIAGLAGGAPFIELGSYRLGVGGLLSYLQLTLISSTLVGLGALVSWTTNVSEIAPAVSKLGKPLKVFRVPVEDWSVALGLALRAFPMLIDEFRVLFAARRIRPRANATTVRERYRRWSSELIDLMATGMTVALRRADEMGDAITARGGSGQISMLPSRPRLADAVAMASVAAMFALALYVEIGTPLSTSS